MTYLSAQAYHRQHGRRDREAIARLEAERMQVGPVLAKDGFTLRIPSIWYNRNAVTFWTQYGFQFNRATFTWTRDTRTAHAGKTYTAEAWLCSTRREFFSFWPGLEADRQCTACKEEFSPKVKTQQLCSSCTDVAQE